MKTEAIRHKATGKIHTITYVLVDLPANFEKQIVTTPRWFCPSRGTCSCQK